MRKVIAFGSQSADGDSFGESVARKELESAMKGELLRMPRRRLPADDHLSVNLLNDQIADPSVRELVNLRFDPFDQAWASVRHF